MTDFQADYSSKIKVLTKPLEIASGKKKKKSRKQHNKDQKKKSTYGL